MSGALDIHVNAYYYFGRWVLLLSFYRRANWAKQSLHSHARKLLTWNLILDASTSKDHTFASFFAPHPLLTITPNYIEYTLSYTPYKEGELQRAKKEVCRVAPKWSVSVVFFDTGLSQTPQSYFNVISKAIEEASMEINYACSLLLNAY